MSAAWVPVLERTFREELLKNEYPVTSTSRCEIFKAVPNTAIFAEGGQLDDSHWWVNACLADNTACFIQGSFLVPRLDPHRPTDEYVVKMDPEIGIYHVVEMNVVIFKPGPAKHLALRKKRLTPAQIQAWQDRFKKGNSVLMPEWMNYSKKLPQLREIQFGAMDIISNLDTSNTQQRPTDLPELDSKEKDQVSPGLSYLDLQTPNVLQDPPEQLSGLNLAVSNAQSQTFLSGFDVYQSQDLSSEASLSKPRRPLPPRQDLEPFEFYCLPRSREVSISTISTFRKVSDGTTIADGEPLSPISSEDNEQHITNVTPAESSSSKVKENHSTVDNNRDNPPSVNKEDGPATQHSSSLVAEFEPFEAQFALIDHQIQHLAVREMARPVPVSYFQNQATKSEDRDRDFFLSLLNGSKPTKVHGQVDVIENEQMASSSFSETMSASLPEALLVTQGSAVTVNLPKSDLTAEFRNIIEASNFKNPVTVQATTAATEHGLFHGHQLDDVQQISQTDETSSTDTSRIDLDTVNLKAMFGASEDWSEHEADEPPTTHDVIEAQDNPEQAQSATPQETDQTPPTALFYLSPLIPYHVLTSFVDREKPAPPQTKLKALPLKPHSPLKSESTNPAHSQSTNTFTEMIDEKLRTAAQKAFQGASSSATADTKLGKDTEEVGKAEHPESESSTMIQTPELTDGLDEKGGTPSEDDAETEVDPHEAREPVHYKLTPRDDILAASEVSILPLADDVPQPESKTPSTLWGILKGEDSNEVSPSETDVGSRYEISAEDHHDREPPATLWGISTAEHDMKKSTDVEVSFEKSCESGHPESSPADLWGVLDLEQTIRESVSEPSVNVVVDLSSESDHPESSPATFWGILKDEQVLEEPAYESDVETFCETPSNTNPATLWGILDGNQTKEELMLETNAEIYHNISSVNDCIEDAPGPATLWSILTSEDTPAVLIPTANDCVEDGLGPATLWGILASEDKPAERIPTVKTTTSLKKSSRWQKTKSSTVHLGQVKNDAVMPNSRCGSPPEETNRPGFGAFFIILLLVIPYTFINYLSAVLSILHPTGPAKAFPRHSLRYKLITTLTHPFICFNNIPTQSLTKMDNTAVTPYPRGSLTWIVAGGHFKTLQAFKKTISFLGSLARPAPPRAPAKPFAKGSCMYYLTIGSYKIYRVLRWLCLLMIFFTCGPERKPTSSPKQEVWMPKLSAGQLPQYRLNMSTTIEYLHVGEEKDNENLEHKEPVQPYRRGFVLFYLTVASYLLHLSLRWMIVPARPYYKEELVLGSLDLEETQTEMVDNESESENMKASTESTVKVDTLTPTHTAETIEDEPAEIDRLAAFKLIMTCLMVREILRWFSGW